MKMRMATVMFPNSMKLYTFRVSKNCIDLIEKEKYIIVNEDGHEYEDPVTIIELFDSAILQAPVPPTHYREIIKTKIVETERYGLIKNIYGEEDRLVVEWTDNTQTWALCNDAKNCKHCKDFRRCVTYCAMKKLYNNDRHAVECDLRRWCDNE